MQHLSTALEMRHNRVELCGFGPVVAAARTAFLIDKWRPEMVMLCGIAGSYSNDLPAGKAFQFRRVASYGVGAGQGTSFQTAAQMGWKQWEQDGLSLGDEIALKSCRGEQQSTRDLLVSVSAASANQEEVDHKRRVYPLAAAEDMEGYSVAVAAALAGLSTRIVRGISNAAGDRRIDQWQIQQAMAAADLLAQRIMKEPGR